jgi:hypothetical protein
MGLTDGKSQRRKTHAIVPSTPKLQNLPKAMETASAILLFLLIDKFPEFVLTPRGKRLAATCAFERSFVKIRETFRPIERK